MQATKQFNPNKSTETAESGPCEMTISWGYQSDRRHHKITVGCRCTYRLWRVSTCEESVGASCQLDDALWQMSTRHQHDLCARTFQLEDGFSIQRLMRISASISLSSPQKMLKRHPWPLPKPSFQLPCSSIPRLCQK